MQDFKSGYDEVHGREGKERFETLERRATIVVQVPFTQRLHLAVREIRFMRNMTGHFGAVLDCYTASCQPKDTWFEWTSTEGPEQNGTKNQDAVHEVGTVVEGQSVQEF